MHPTSPPLPRLPFDCLLRAACHAPAAGVSSEAARIRQQELASLRTELDTERARSNNLQKMVEELEDSRRRMHNTIQELRGSVRVFVRARPFLDSDGEDASQVTIKRVLCVSTSTLLRCFSWQRDRTRSDGYPRLMCFRRSLT